MHNLPKLPEYSCPRCGWKTNGPGECMACRMRSPYDKGYEDGQASVFPKIPVYEPRKIEFDFRTDYQKGLDDGKRDALGCSGRNGFMFIGV